MQGIRSREEALTTPFICLKKNKRSISAWKRRVLLEGYCKLLTYDNQELAKCRYCHVDLPYSCVFRVKPAYLFFEKLFTNGFRKLKES